MDLALNGRVALVTGGGRGIGRGISKVLAEEGAHVIIGDVVLSNAQDTVEFITREGGSASPEFLDVTDPKSVQKVFMDSINQYGKIDVLINNAGITRMSDFLHITIDEYKLVFEVNTTGTFLCCQEFAKQAIHNKYGGNIVNIASNAGKVGFPNQSHYNAAKSAVINLTRNLALELAVYNINVNAICPGAAETEMLFDVAKSLVKTQADDANSIMQSFAPAQLGRLVQPREIGRVVAFLVSDAAQIIRGQSINVDAGSTPY